ncbi:energy-coupling factor transporter ATPase [Limosilactobacillus mucosae]|uniref:energy-coupling factor transporter ATPase n=1 Tax=Limosilactobacillus mucosae TaxID=97478 RepID=UPI0022E8FF10|nr:energy-coupling factor transporter ATPase [Limosilactobacillus mucosae]
MSAIEFLNVDYIYQADTPMAAWAIKDFSLKLETGSFTAIVGHTGSGKSTLMAMLDGLLVPTHGQLRVGEVVIDNRADKKTLARLRQGVGYVFQFPESQLFAETVLKDVMFGPLNLGVSPAQAKEQALTALEALKLPSDINERSPFELSGGQMRRVAIAGVLAMHPSVLILDEPTAGLDPQASTDLLDLVDELHQKGTTILMITHQMEQAARFADHVLVMNHGQKAAFMTPHELFSNAALLNEAGIMPPASVAFAQQLQSHGLFLADSVPLTIEKLADQLTIRLKQGGRANG